MTLYTKCIKSPISDTDGFRISVMSQHTLNDGKTPDSAISPDLFDEHWPELAPSPKLMGSYYKRGLVWQKFEVDYLSHIRQEHIMKRVYDLIQLAVSEEVTILCIETSPENCHRRLLAEECKRLNPSLELIVS